MWATSPGKKQGSTFHFSIRCPVKTDAESDSSTTSTSSSIEHELSLDVDRTAQPGDHREDPGSTWIRWPVNMQQNMSSRCDLPHFRYRKECVPLSDRCVTIPLVRIPHVCLLKGKSSYKKET